MVEKSSKQIEIPELLTLREACEILKCHPNTLRNWDRNGTLRAVRIGGRGDRRFKKEDINAFIQSSSKA
jgi:excisionase family DNA binding protein